MSNKRKATLAWLLESSTLLVKELESLGELGIANAFYSK